MNADLLRKVADVIEVGIVANRRVGLNMQMWHGDAHPCGTSACVAGFTELVVTQGRGWKNMPVPDGATRHYAKASLELTEVQARELFHACTFAEKRGEDKSIYAMHTINRNERLVPDALRWMADTGIVDWSDALTAACDKRSPR